MIAAKRRLGGRDQQLALLDGILGLSVGAEGGGEVFPCGQRVRVSRAE